MKKLILFVILGMFSIPAFGTDVVFYSGNAPDYEPELAGSRMGWGQWFVVTVYNSTGKDVQLTEFGFPTCGSATGAYGWVVWTDLGSFSPPGTGPTGCDHHGAFVPVEPEGGDPTVYTYVDISAENVVIPAGAHFCFGYENMDLGGQTVFNGTETWSWDDGAWNSDSQFNRTAVMQVTAIEEGSLSSSTWGAIKGAVGSI